MKRGTRSITGEMKERGERMNCIVEGGKEGRALFLCIDCRKKASLTAKTPREKGKEKRKEEEKKEERKKKLYKK